MSSKRKIRKKDDNPLEQRIIPLDRLLRERRVPILFIGSGITRRYCNTVVWNQLLESIASKVGIDKFQLNGIRKKLESETPDQNVNPALASKLRGILIDKISDGLLHRSDFPEISDDEWKLMEEQDPFKVLVCNRVSGITLVDDDKLNEELCMFRNLSSKIPAVITTNYDEFLEKEVFTAFSVLVSPDDYYFNDSDGYGEILKIHGTIGNPNSIVITSEDYENLRSNSKIIISKLTSMMCNSPIIFIGYSMSDPEINEIVTEIVSALKQTDLDKIKSHLLRVNVDTKLTKTIWNTTSLEHDGKSAEIININMPSLDILYNYLDKFTPIATPYEIRKYRDMIRDIVLTADPVSRRLILINEAEIDSARPGDMAVIFGRQDSLNSMMKGILGYDISDVLEDVLFDRRGMIVSKTMFLAWISDRRICSGIKYIPVHHYILRFNLELVDLPDHVVKFIDDMVMQMEKKVDAMRPLCEGVNSKEGIEQFLQEQTKSFHRCEALMYFYDREVIDSGEFRDMLQKEYSTILKNNGDKAKMPSDLRCALSFLDYKKYRDTKK